MPSPLVSLLLAASVFGLSAQGAGGMGSAGQGTGVVRNSWLGVGVVLAGSAFAVFLALCLAVLAIGSCLPLHGLTLQRGVNALLWGCGAGCCALMGASWWGTGTRMAFHRVRFDERGVDFRLGTRRNPQTQFFPWEQISTVSHRRQGNAHYYAVHGLDGRSATFSSYTFFRPRKVARMVAARAGQSIQEA